MSESGEYAARVLRGRDEIYDAILGLDADAIRRLVHQFGVSGGTDVVVADVLVPVLRTVGEMWADGKLSVLHEHHASGIIRSMVGQLRRPAMHADRPTVVLACPPGELHDLPAHLFSLMLIDRGLAPIVLGADTPWKATASALRSAGAQACVLSGMRPGGIRYRHTVLKMLASTAPVFVAGPLGEGLEVPGVQPLSEDWRVAADVVRDGALPLDAAAGATGTASSARKASRVNLPAGIPRGSLPRG